MAKTKAKAKPKQPAKRPGPLDTECPRCHAAPRQPCRAPSGRPAGIHAARRNPGQHNRGGRQPHRLTDDIRDLIAAALRLGAPLNMAAANAGIPTSVLYRWLARADSDDPTDAPYRDMRDVLAHARAQAGVRALSRIDQVARGRLKSREPVVVVGKDGPVAVLGPDGKPLLKEVYEQDWRAAAFVLERQFARDFGRRETVELATGDGAGLPSGVESVGAAAGSDGDGIGRIVSSIAAFRARKELEAGDGEVVEGEIVDG